MRQSRTNPIRNLHLRGVVLPAGVARDLYVVAGRITFRPPEDASTVLDGGFLIPGLVDTHAHLELSSPAPPHASPRERSQASAREHLAAGVLAIREPGGPAHASNGLGPDQGLPRIVTAGHFLAPPDGYFPGLAREVTEEQLPEAAEEEARASGAWAKVVGDWIDPDGVQSLNYRAATLAEAARRVHALGARIAIHAASPASIEAAIEAGFDSIEHGVGLRDDHLGPMVERGITLVPTLLVAEILRDNPDFLAGAGWDAESVEATQIAGARHPEMTFRAFQAGVVVLAGTDAGLLPHGMVRREIGLLLLSGLPSEAALAAGSWRARDFLRLPGLEEGAPADIVAYSDDPRSNPEVLAHPLLRILDGHVVPTPTV